MSAVWAGSLAVFAALFINRLLVNSWGIGSVFWGVPLVEELCKLGAAFVFNASFRLTYLVFGLGEAFYDLRTKQSSGFSAALFSIVSHYCFGLSAELVWRLSRNIFLVILITVIAHGLWNRIVLGFCGRKRIK